MNKENLRQTSGVFAFQKDCAYLCTKYKDMHNDYNYNTAIQECDEVCTRQFVSCNNLEATIGTNGIHGRDAGHGGVTCFKLKDLASTCWSVQVKKDEYDRESLEIVLRGDCELQTFANALMWAGLSLKRIECTKKTQ